MSGFRQPECPREQMVLWEQRLDDAVLGAHPRTPAADLKEAMRVTERLRSDGQ